MKHSPYWCCHCSHWSSGFQCRWSRHPSTAATARLARGQRSWLLEAGQRDTEDHGYVSVQAQTTHHRRTVYGVQSELSINSPPSRRDICPRRVVWRGECSVCGRHSATPTNQSTEQLCLRRSTTDRSQTSSVA